MPSLPPQVQKILTDLDKKLHEPGILTNALDTVEKKTTLKRLHVVAGCMVVYALYLLFGSWAQFFCNLTGFFYPAYFGFFVYIKISFLSYLSIKAIESHVKEDDTQWLTYWVVFALLNVVEFFSETILYYFPFYWLLKCVFLLWLYMPASPGALLVYDRLIRPFHLQYQGHIEDKLSSASQSAREGFNKNVKDN